MFDAGEAIGGGHLARCAALADALAALGWSSTAVSDLDPATILSRVATSFDQWDQRKEPPTSCAAAVFDGYKLNLQLEREWRRCADIIVAIDDLPQRDHDVDIIVDATPGRDARSYQTHVPDGCRIFAGAEFALLRPCWRMFRARRGDSEPDRIGRVVVSTGATDPQDVTTHFAKELLTALPDVQVTAILGQGAIRQKVQAGLGPQIELVIDPADFEKRIASADLVIGAAGSSSLERACVGVPTIACVIAENQKEMAAALRKLGLAVVLERGEWANPYLLRGIISDLAGSRDRRSEISRRARATVDGRGAQRLVSRFARPRTVKGSLLQLRLFEYTDSEWLFWLQQKAETSQVRPDHDRAVPLRPRHLDPSAFA